MNKHTIVQASILLVIFIFALQPAIDPDTGWHIATGRYIYEQGHMPDNDPFSYSMPDSKYYAHAWGTDLIMFFIHKWFGTLGLSNFFAILITISMGLFASIAQKMTSRGNYVALLPLLALVTIEIAGVRPQVISILGLSILLNILLNKHTKPKIWYLPLLFGIWANLHGGVVLGVGVFSVWVMVSAFMEKDFEIWYWMKNICLAIAATLINPYTYHLYIFAFGMVVNKTALTYNTDWIPLFSSRLGDDSLPLRISIVVGSLVAIIDNKQRKVVLALASIFLVASLKSLRFLVPLLPLIAPLVLLTLDKIMQKINTTKWFAPALLICVSVMFYDSLVDKNKVRCATKPDCYGELANMPYKATVFIQEQGLKGNFFNHYTWGGYLEWQLPQAKFFIDGRMDNFFKGKQSFLEEFVNVDLMRAGWYESLIAYQTDYALMPSTWQKQTKYLKEQGWKEVYADERTVLLKR